eukprot:3129552-Prymnesium_polylepis.1
MRPTRRLSAGSAELIGSTRSMCTTCCHARRRRRASARRRRVTGNMHNKLVGMAATAAAHAPARVAVS